MILILGWLLRRLVLDCSQCQSPGVSTVCQTSLALAVNVFSSGQHWMNDYITLMLFMQRWTESWIDDESCVFVCVAAASAAAASSPAQDSEVNERDAERLLCPDEDGDLYVLSPSQSLLYCSSIIHFVDISVSKTEKQYRLDQWWWLVSSHARSGFCKMDQRSVVLRICLRTVICVFFCIFWFMCWFS